MKQFLKWLFNFPMTGEDILCKIIEWEDRMTEDDLRQAAEYLKYCYEWRVQNRIKEEKQNERIGAN